MINLNDEEQKREIRVFVSSTFNDMQDERDHLVKNVFPKLRKISQSRGVELTEVDLRWGVTEAQAEDGKVIEICLQEIDRCRPYFIGLLGERYGWVPAAEEYEQHRRILEDFPWVREDLDEGLSITEMEIQYGVLRNPAMESRAFFYLRDPASTPAEFREDEGSDAAEKLTNLKSLLTAQEDYPSHQFKDSNDLEQLITDDFTQFIDAEFPEGDTPSPLERAQQDHAAFARSRLKIYLGGEEYFKQLDAHADSAQPPLVVVGESGSGKSALLANWIAHLQEKHPDEFVLYHFIGGAPDSSDHITLMRRIMEEMIERFEITDEVPTDPDKVAEALPLFLAQTPHAKRWVLVLDALNQLEEKNNARWLGWLPTFIPENIRVVVSTLPGEALDALEKREYPQLAVQPMNKEVRKQLIRSYLALYTKELSEDLVNQIASGPASGNPLILRALLDEIRIFGVHEELQERIDYYLEPRAPGEFFDAVLQRLETDYEHERPGMVGEVLSLIWASRRGLAERELLEVTSIPPLFWTPLYHALDAHLVSRGGLLDFFHDYLRQAIEARYLATVDKQHVTHNRLAEYFAQIELNDRVVDERPYHLHKAEQWEQLKDCIGDLDLFERLIDGGRANEVLGYWHAIGDRYEMESVYGDSLHRYEVALKAKTVGDPAWQPFATVLDKVASFLHVQGARYATAETLLRRALEIRERVLGTEHPDTAGSINNLAGLLNAQGDYAAAESLFRRALEVYELAFGAEHPATAKIVGNLAGSLEAQGSFAAAEPFYRRALEIHERVLGAEHPDTATSVNNLAILLKAQGDYTAAEPLYRRALEIRERVQGAEHPQTATSINNLAILLQAQGDFTAAEPLYRRALEIRERVQGAEHPDTAGSINNLAGLLQDQGDYAAAESLCRRALDIYERVLGAEHPDTTTGVCNLAILLKARGDYAAAEPLFRRALDIRERVLGTEHPDTATSVNDLAGLLGAQGDYAAAEPLFRRALGIREQVLGTEHPDTAGSINNLAALFYSVRDYAAAEPLYRRALGIRERVLGAEHPDTASSVNNLALLLKARGDFASAEPLFRRALDITERLLGAEHRDTATHVNNLATLLLSRGDYAAAEPLFRRALDINERALGAEHPNTAASVNNLAGLFHAQGDYAAATPLVRRAMEICERVQGVQHPATATSASNLAALLQAQGDYAAAEPLFRRALEIRDRALGAEHPATASSVNSLAALYCSHGDYAAALPLVRRAMEMNERVLGPQHPDTATSMNNLARLLGAQGDFAAAEPLHRRVLEIREQVLGAAHPDTDSVRHKLAMLCMDREDFLASKTLFLESLTVREDLFGLESQQVASTLTNLSFLYRKQQRYSEAEPINERALEVYRSALGTAHPSTANTGVNLTLLKFDLDKIEEAAELCARFLEPHRANQEHADTIAQQQLRKLADCFHQLALRHDVPAQNWQAAEAHYQVAIDYLAQLNDDDGIALVNSQVQEMRELPEFDG